MHAAHPARGGRVLGGVLGGELGVLGGRLAARDNDVAWRGSFARREGPFGAPGGPKGAPGDARGGDRRAPRRLLVAAAVGEELDGALAVLDLAVLVAHAACAFRGRRARVGARRCRRRGRAGRRR